MRHLQEDILTKRGLMLSGTVFSHCLHSAIVALAYRGTPQLHYVSSFFSDPILGGGRVDDLPFRAHQIAPSVEQ